MEKEEKISTAVSLYQELESILVQIAGKANFLENSVLWLSIFTTGSLWLLITETLPGFALWIGALISTLVTGITAYLQTSGINKKRASAVNLHKEISNFLAKIRSPASVDEDEFWTTYKDIETRVRTLEYRREE